MLCRLKVEGQTLRWYGGPQVLAADSVDFVGFEFLLPKDWEGYTLHATFQQADKAYTQVLEDRKCTLPSEIGVGNCGIGLFGYQPGKAPRATTNLLNVQVCQSGFIPDGEYPVPPTPDLYSQLLSHLDYQTNVAKLSADNAAESAHQAQSYANQARSGADRAEQAALNPPKLSEDYTWMVWNPDTGKYEDTGLLAEGKPGKDGYTPVKGIDYFDGAPGKDGKNGKDGRDGADGYTPIKGVDYRDGIDGKDGRNGVDGKNGKDGADGYTPVKGVDYFTDADKQELVQDVLNALPNAEEGAF